MIITAEPELSAPAIESAANLQLTVQYALKVVNAEREAKDAQRSAGLTQLYSVGAPASML